MDNVSSMKADNIMSISSADVSNTMTSLGQSSANALQGNVAAMMEAGRIWAMGCQAIRETMAAAAQTHLAATVSTWKAMSGVKSPKEALDLHADLARRTLEAAYAETSKLAAASVGLAGATMVPLATRITSAAQAVTNRPT